MNPKSSYYDDTRAPVNLPVEMKNIIRNLSGNTPIRRKAARRRLLMAGEDDPSNLIPLLDTNSEKIRWETMKVLVRLDDKKLIPLFMKLLTDDYSDIRWMAAEGLIQYGRRVVNPLIKKILQEKDSPFLREGAYHVLSDYTFIRDREVLSPLLSCLGNRYIPEERLKATAAKVLEEHNRHSS